MKTRLFVMVGLIVSVTTMAQKPAREFQRTESHGLERMKRELGLTERQYASIKGIESRYEKKRDAERKKYELMRLEERKTMHSLRVEREREIRSVLSATQSKKLDAQKIERKKHRDHTMAKRKHNFKDRKQARAREYGRHRDR